MAEPFVTVLIPVYNCEAYIGLAVESVLSQSYRDYELLIVDDGSSDGTGALLEQYAARDARIRVLHHPNSGVGHTINRGIREARGVLIAELGADDLALPGRLQKQVDFLERNPTHVLVGGWLRLIDAAGAPIGLRKYPSTDHELRRSMLLYNPFGSPALMYRRNAALQAGGYTSRFSTSEDYDFLLRLAKLGDVANLTEPLTAYRLHQGATKSQKTRRQLRDTVSIKRTAYREYGYRETTTARAVNFAQDLLSYLPGSVAYWLFTKLAVAGEQS